MSITRYVGALAMSTALCAGCQGPDVQEETAQVAQGVRIFTPTNSSLAFGGMIDGVPIRGIRLQGPNGYVMTTNNDQADRIASMAYGKKSVSALTAPNGVLQATVNGETITTFTATAPLILNLEDSLRGKLKIYAAQTMEGYTAYTAEFSRDGSSWQAFCPHSYVYTNNQGELEDFIAEPMIPVGGAKWSGSNGSRIEDPAAITLSCRHDAIGGCITWGYVPWETGSWHGTPVQLIGYHQACTRLKRADFCGSGTPHTTLNEGIKKHTTIQVWDTAGLYDMPPQTLASMEAGWSPAGATCYNNYRFRTDDTTSSYYGMFLEANRCPKPACTTMNPGFIMMGSARPAP
jgi:hypothetical protein